MIKIKIRFILLSHRKSSICFDGILVLYFQPTLTLPCFFLITYEMEINGYDIDEIAEGAVILDGLDEAIIGVTEEFGNNPRILYSKDKILNILCERDGMDMEEAIEFYDYNILGLYAGEQNPIFLFT